MMITWQVHEKYKCIGANWVDARFSKPLSSKMALYIFWSTLLRMLQPTVSCGHQSRSKLCKCQSAFLIKTVILCKQKYIYLSKPQAMIRGCVVSYYSFFFTLVRLVNTFQMYTFALSYKPVYLFFFFILPLSLNLLSRW